MDDGQGGVHKRRFPPARQDTLRTAQELLLTRTTRNHLLTRYVSEVGRPPAVGPLSMQEGVLLWPSNLARKGILLALKVGFRSSSSVLMHVFLRRGGDRAVERRGRGGGGGRGGEGTSGRSCCDQPFEFALLGSGELGRAWSGRWRLGSGRGGGRGRGEGSSDGEGGRWADDGAGGREHGWGGPALQPSPIVSPLSARVSE